MAIVHPDVFPEGTAPDSIDWRIWNAPHVIYGPSGEVLSFGGIADGEFLKRDGDEIVGAAAGGSLFVKRVLFSDFVVQGDGWGWVPDFYTIPAGSILTYAGIELVEFFDDSAAGALDLNSVSGAGALIGNIVAISTPSEFLDTINPFAPIGGDAPVFPPSPEATTYRAVINTLISPMLVPFADDGTTGIADIYLRIETATELP